MSWFSISMTLNALDTPSKIKLAKEAADLFGPYAVLAVDETPQVYFRADITGAEKKAALLADRFLKVDIKGIITCQRDVFGLIAPDDSYAHALITYVTNSANECEKALDALIKAGIIYKAAIEKSPEIQTEYKSAKKVVNNLSPCFAAVLISPILMQKFNIMLEVGYLEGRKSVTETTPLATLATIANDARKTAPTARGLLYRLLAHELQTLTPQATTALARSRAGTVSAPPRP